MRYQNAAGAGGYADIDRDGRRESAASRAIPNKKPAPLSGTLRRRQKAPRALAGRDLPRTRGLIPFDEPHWVGGKASRTMDHTRQVRAVVAAAALLAQWGCGDGGASKGTGESVSSGGTSAAAAASGRAGSAPSTPSTDGAAPAASGGADAAKLELAIDGRDPPLEARAQLTVKEGQQTVQLGISGSNGGDDLLLLELEFDDIDSCLGTHAVTLGLPGSAENSANANFSDLPYHSQNGEVDLTLDASGAISGTFQLGLARDPDMVAGQPVTFAPSDDLWMISGRFDGSWILNCFSYLPAHRESRILGGSYCDNLKL